MVAGRLGIFYSRCSHTIPQAEWTPPFGIQPAPGRFFILYSRIEGFFHVARCAALPLESAARKGFKSTSAIQSTLAATRRAAPHFTERNGYNFQSEQSQPSICSTFAMSSANRL